MYIHWDVLFILLDKCVVYVSNNDKSSQVPTQKVSYFGISFPYTVSFENGLPISTGRYCIIIFFCKRCLVGSFKKMRCHCHMFLSVLAIVKWMSKAVAPWQSYKSTTRSVFEALKLLLAWFNVILQKKTLIEYWF